MGEFEPARDRSPVPAPASNKGSVQNRVSKKSKQNIIKLKMTTLLDPLGDHFSLKSGRSP
jgi:hypothetical protein